MTFSNAVFLAPLCDVTSMPFRRLCRRQGADIVVTEMVSADAIIYGDERSRLPLTLAPDEHPVGVQLMGRRPDVMAAAATVAESQGADFVDINAGCPMRRIVSGGAGAALMRDPALLADIVRAVCAAVRIPVTVKIRSGWDAASQNAVEVAERAEQAGARAVTVHGRTRAQMYTGRADWSVIARVREAVTVPVIGNGDIDSAAAAARMRATTGCHSVMVGRAALGNPWLFRAIQGTGPLRPTADEFTAVVLGHLADLVDYTGPQRAVCDMRRHLVWYSRGYPGAAAFRKTLPTLGTVDAVRQAILDFVNGFTSTLGSGFGTCEQGTTSGDAPEDAPSPRSAFAATTETDGES